MTNQTHFYSIKLNNGKTFGRFSTKEKCEVMRDRQAIRKGLKKSDLPIVRIETAE